MKTKDSKNPQKVMLEKLCIMLEKKVGGVDQYVDLRSIVLKCGLKIEKKFRGNKFVTDDTAGRYEVWIEVPDWSQSKAGKGNSLGEAVKDAVSYCFRSNSILQ